MNDLIEMALAAGIEDRSYDTVRYGRVSSYRGIVAFTPEGYGPFVACGYEVEGNAQVITKSGYIQVLPVREQDMV